MTYMKYMMNLRELGRVIPQIGSYMMYMGELA